MLAHRAALFVIAAVVGLVPAAAVQKYSDREGGLSIAAVNRMIAGAVRGVKARGK